MKFIFRGRNCVKGKLVYVPDYHLFYEQLLFGDLYLFFLNIFTGYEKEHTLMV